MGTQVPQRTSSLAHVVPETALVRRSPAGPADILGIESYIAALNDPALPASELQWEGRDRIRIRATVLPGQVVSVQESYHPGWTARVNGRRGAVNRDALGLMWLRAECAGDCDIKLEYGGGLELGVCWLLSYGTIVALIAWLAARVRSRVRVG